MPNADYPRDRPATLHDLDAAEQRTVELLTEIMRDMQTEILKGLQGSHVAIFARIHSFDTTLTDTNTRLAFLEERVLNLETRRHRGRAYAPLWQFGAIRMAP